MLYCQNPGQWAVPALEFQRYNQIAGIFDRIHAYALNMDVHTILRTLVALELGYQSVSPEQQLVIESFLNGEDVFVSIPTSYWEGKSLCYWVLPCRCF